MNFKSTLKDLTPPFLWKWLRNKAIHNQRNKKKYDDRRWWYGEDLEGDNSRFDEIFISGNYVKIWLCYRCSNDI